MKARFFRSPCVGSLAVLAAVASAALTPGVKWFVAATGTDSPGCGSTADLACRNIQYVMDRRASGGDTICVASGTYPELLTIRKNLTVQGPPDGSAIVDGTHSGTVVTVPAGVTATIENLTIQNGSIASNAKQNLAGGILNEGNLRLSVVLVISNSAATEVALESALAGGVVNAIGASLDMDRASIVSNSGNGGCSAAGGLNSQGTLSTHHTFFAENAVSSPAGLGCGKSGPITANSLLNGAISVH